MEIKEKIKDIEITHDNFGKGLQYFVEIRTFGLTLTELIELLKLIGIDNK